MCGPATDQCTMTVTNSTIGYVGGWTLSWGGLAWKILSSLSRATERTATSYVVSPSCQLGVQSMYAGRLHACWLNIMVVNLSQPSGYCCEHCCRRGCDGLWVATNTFPGRNRSPRRTSAIFGGIMSLGTFVEINKRLAKSDYSKLFLLSE